MSLKNKDKNALDRSSSELGTAFKEVFKERVLGPEYPIIQRINNLYIKVITLKVEREVSPKQVKERVQEMINTFYSSVSNKTTRISIDVDPN